jgi:hypothetical protein
MFPCGIGKNARLGGQEESLPLLIEKSIAIVVTVLQIRRS